MIVYKLAIHKTTWMSKMFSPKCGFPISKCSISTLPLPHPFKRWSQPSASSFPASIRSLRNNHPKKKRKRARAVSTTANFRPVSFLHYNRDEDPGVFYEQSTALFLHCLHPHNKSPTPSAAFKLHQRRWLTWSNLAPVPRPASWR